MRDSSEWERRMEGDSSAVGVETTARTRRNAMVKCLVDDRMDAKTLAGNFASTVNLAENMLLFAKNPLLKGNTR